MGLRFASAHLSGFNQTVTINITKMGLWGSLDILEPYYAKLAAANLRPQNSKAVLVEAREGEAFAPYSRSASLTI